MARPIEKALIAITLAGIALALVVLRQPMRTTDVTQTAAPVSGATTVVTRTPATKPLSSTIASSPATSGPVTDPVDTRPNTSDPGDTAQLPVGSTTTYASHPTVPTSSPTTSLVVSPTSLPTMTVPPSTSSPTTSLVVSPTSLVATTEASAVSTAPSSTTVQSSTSVSPPVSSSTTAVPAVSPDADERPEAPQRCASVEEVWKWDGHPVEDACTLAEVKRVMRWAWTGSDDQRRSAIRNSHLLDEVFAALEEVGREIGAGVFHSETRQEWSIRFRNIRWHGGPHFDRAVIAVDYRARHPDYQPGSWRTVTLVQIDGDWKLSYREGYCRVVTPMLEYFGSDTRCPPDPNPEINEYEYPDAIPDY